MRVNLPCDGWLLLVLIIPAVAGVADAEECSNPSSSLQDVFANDGDLPLSLLQVRAIAKRRSKVEALMHSHNASNLSFPKKISDAGGRIVSSALVSHSDSWKACYFAIGLLLAILVVNGCIMHTQVKRKEIRNTKYVPKILNPVDHFVAKSKLDSPTDNLRSQLRFYARAPGKDDHASFFEGLCTRAVDTMMAKAQPEPETLGASPMSDQASPTAEKAHKLGEVLDPKLVLPLRETWYAVAVEKILEDDGSFEILRITGSPSLRATVSHGNRLGSDSVLELCYCSGNTGNNSEEPGQLLARASCPSRRNIFGKEEAAEDRPISLVGAGERSLGQLRTATSRRFELVRDTEVRLVLSAKNAGQLELALDGGSRLAVVSCFAGHLGICLNAGADTGLSIAFVLAAIVLGDAAPLVLPLAGGVRRGVCDEDRCIRETGATPILDALPVARK